MIGRVINLTDVKRQAEGSSILRSATSLRDAMEWGRNWHIESERSFGLKGAVNGYLRSFNPSRLDAAVYIAPFHKSLTQFNTTVRQQLGYSASVSVGDIIVFHQNFVIADYTAFNGDFGTVVEIISGAERFGGLHFQEIAVEVIDEHGLPKRVAGKVCLEFIQAEKAELMREQENTLYSEVMRTDKTFRESKFRQNHQNPYLGAMRLRYGYGITGHKAQGSEFNSVFLNTWSPNGNPNLNYLYTGVTRAQERLVCSA